MRLYLFRPSAAEVGSIGWYQAGHLASFVVAYLLWRGRVRPRETRFPVPDRATVVAALFAYLVIGVCLLFLDWRFDLSARTYLESYLVTRRLPLEVAQLAFRATTFVLVGYFFYRFLPVAIGVKALASMLRAMPRTRVTGTHVRFERAS